MFNIILSANAEKVYLSLDNKTAGSVNTAFDIICENPYNGKNIKKLKGKLNGLYRFRAGIYRIVYSIDKEIKIVSIIWIGKRKDIYK